ncbi:MAG: hypothetical protein KAR84_03660 [Elusimicrobiales bacterium]|nr:hypothetical protein [Elusimicrobiales bacterium]
MKKLSAVILITALISPVCALENEALRNSFEYKNASEIAESIDLKAVNFPINIKAQKQITWQRWEWQQWGSSKPNTDHIIDAQYIFLARMQANTIKMIALTLQSLEEMNSSNKAPTKYTKSVSFYAKEIEKTVRWIGYNLESETKNYKLFFVNSTEIKMKTAELKEAVKLIENHENYDFWFGTDLIQTANELNAEMSALRKVLPDMYSFITPELKTKRLKTKWEKFVKTGIEDLNSWEKLYMEKKLDYDEFTSLVDAKISLKEMWELYQESVMHHDNYSFNLRELWSDIVDGLKNKSKSKFVKACFIKEIKDNNCVYKCTGGSTYTTPIERPLPNFDYDKSSIVCPQVVFPF